jgi:hypothetical protein
MTRPDRRACLPIIPHPSAAHAVAPTAQAPMLRRHGHNNIVAALRYHARHTTRILPLLGITSP